MESFWLRESSDGPIFGKFLLLVSPIIAQQFLVSFKARNLHSSFSRKHICFLPQDLLLLGGKQFLSSFCFRNWGSFQNWEVLQVIHLPQNPTVPKQNPKARGTVPRAAPSAAAPSLGKTLRPVGQAVGLHVLAKHKTSAKP